MALRYLARRVGIAALRQASGARVTPSAGSGPLASRSSQAGYSTEDAGRRSKEMMESVAKHNTTLNSTADDIIMRARRVRRLETLMTTGSAVISFGFFVYIYSAFCREVQLIMWERDIERELMETMEEEDMDEEEMGEADMSGDKRG